MADSPDNVPVSFTHAFDVDVFLSYGHIDNQSNWVTNFHTYLQQRLQQLLGTEQIVIWRDPQLDGTVNFPELLRAKISKSALFVSVLSPRYVTSPSCREELDWFVTAAQANGGLRVETQSRLIRVVKTRLLEAKEPSNFKATLGYEFYVTDPQNPGMFWEFSSEKGMSRFDQFEQRCEILSQSVARLLLKIKQMAERYPSTPQDDLSNPPDNTKMGGKTVFVAQTTRDLEPFRASIRAELVGRGHTVLPTQPLPDTGPEFRAAAQAMLSNANVSVHLIGRSYGGIPEEETKSFGELHYELALAQKSRADFRQLVWIPEDLQNPEARQEAFLARLSNDDSPPISRGSADVIKTSFEGFKEELLDVLSRKPGTQSLSSETKYKAVYLLCDQPDLKREQLTKIKEYLRSRGHVVDLPPFQGDPEELRELEEELIGDTDAALIYYGAAKDAWILRKRRSLLKVLSKKQAGRGYARALYLCTPKDEMKDDYLDVPNHLYPESPAFPPLLVLGDCEDFEPKKLDAFLQLIEEAA